jgi:hypothetical protein
VLKVADYDTLYKLAALEQGRRHTGIWNQHEPGPFPGDYRSKWTPRVKAVLKRARGGRFAALLDTTNRTHSVSTFSLQQMLNP